MGMASSQRLHLGIPALLVLLLSPLLLVPAAGAGARALAADAGAAADAAPASGPAIAIPSGSAAADEAAIMQHLRNVAAALGISQGRNWAGWSPGSPAHHCLWDLVSCNAAGWVTQIKGMSSLDDWDWMDRANTTGAPKSPAAPGAANARLLLPELAQLQWLEHLDIWEALRLRVPLPGSIPREWGLPGAFPRLKKLRLRFPALSGTLPDIHPGALPLLSELALECPEQEQPMELPPSWGASPLVLPLLQTLTIQARVALPLPAAWSRGFSSLETLALVAPFRLEYINKTAADVPEPAAAPPAARNVSPRAARCGSALPDEWARGFPSLAKLTLPYLGVAGTFPDSWQAPGAFPMLQDIDLESNCLRGPLPPRIFSSLPNLLSLGLANNQLTGPLPAEWAECRRRISIFLHHNQLKGPAIPAAWTAAALRVERLVIGSNPHLNGTLPEQLAWKELLELGLSGTGVTGTIPAAWCQAPFNSTLAYLDLDHTKMLDQLPACAARDLPKLWGNRFPPPPPPPAASADTVVLATAGAASGRGKVALASMLLAVVALVAAAAVAGGLATRRRRQQRQANGRWQRLPQQPTHADGLASLVQRARAQATQRSDGVEEPSSEVSSLLALQHSSHQLPGGHAVPVPELVPGRARLKELLQLELASMRQGVEVLGPGALPPALVHQLAAGGCSPESGNTLMPSGEQQQQLGGSSGGGGGAPERQWGLQSESLRLDPSRLQFVAEDDGGLVQLGEGAHGVVYLAKLAMPGDGLYVAVKVLHLGSDLRSSRFWREVQLLRHCAHPRMVPVYGVALQGQLLMVAMRLMLGGSLRAALCDQERREQLRWGARGRQVALDVAEALAHLHGEAHVLHSDIKSANVLLGTDWRARLSDLGTAQALGAGSARTAAGGSRLYAAPEQLMGERCTLAADVYSFGLCLVELCSRRLISRRASWALPRAPGDCPQEVLDLIQDCLQVDPWLRPSAAQALQRLQQSGGGSSNAV